MTEAALDSKHTSHWRLGLTIVLVWPMHRTYYISSYHRQSGLTTLVVCVRAGVWVCARVRAQISCIHTLEVHA